MYSRIYTFIIYILLFFLQDVSAYVLISPIKDTSKISTSKSPIELLSQIGGYAINITAILAIIGITVGGLMLVLAAGDEEKVKKGRKILIYSLVGVGIAGLAFGVVQTVASFRI